MKESMFTFLKYTTFLLIISYIHSTTNTNTNIELNKELLNKFQVDHKSKSINDEIICDKVCGNKCVEDNRNNPLSVLSCLQSCSCNSNNFTTVTSNNDKNINTGKSHTQKEEVPVVSNAKQSYLRTKNLGFTLFILVILLCFIAIALYAIKKPITEKAQNIKEYKDVELLKEGYQDINNNHENIEILNSPGMNIDTREYFRVKDL